LKLQLESNGKACTLIVVRAKTIKTLERMSELTLPRLFINVGLRDEIEAKKWLNDKNKALSNFIIKVTSL